LHKIKKEYKTVNKNVKILRPHQAKTKCLFWTRVIQDRS
jgi:hypothetical protein